jgi:hypothetical protein
MLVINIDLSFGIAYCCCVSDIFAEPWAIKESLAIQPENGTCRQGQIRQQVAWRASVGAPVFPAHRPYRPVAGPTRLFMSSPDKMSGEEICGVADIEDPHR